jgi:isocitrate dehydrogenase
MTKKAQKAVKFYNEMVADDMVHTTWTHEDYDDVTVYEDVNGDIVCVQRNEKGEIVDAWTE